MTAPRSRGTVRAGAQVRRRPGSVSISTRSSTSRENERPRRSVSSPSAGERVLGAVDQARVDVQEEQRRLGQPARPTPARTTTRSARRPLELERLGGREDLRRQARRAAAAPRPEQTLVAEDLAGLQVEEGLELDEELPHRHLVGQPERVDLAARLRQRRQPAHGVPLGLARVLGGDAHALGERAHALLEVRRGNAPACARRGGAAPGRTSEARAQFRPNAAATARSASTPSGRTKTARAVRQRSSRPRIWPSRTLPETFTLSIVRRDTRIGAVN